MTMNRKILITTTAFLIMVGGFTMTTFMGCGVSENTNMDNTDSVSIVVDTMMNPDTMVVDTMSMGGSDK